MVPEGRDVMVKTGSPSRLSLRSATVRSNPNPPVLPFGGVMRNSSVFPGAAMVATPLGFVGVDPLAPAFVRFTPGALIGKLGFVTDPSALKIISAGGVPRGGGRLSRFV